jgi:pimeloyl-ACP methyl ester carboxylesterase
MEPGAIINGMSAERLTIRNDLVGDLRRGTSTKLIIFCHGYRSSSKHPALVILSKGLHQKGHSTFAFDFSGTDPMDIPGQVSDIEAVIAYFQKEYAEIILLAGSFGALPAAIAAAQTEVSGLITINGFFGFMRLGRAYQSKYILFRLLTLLAPAQKKTWQYYRQAFNPHKLTSPVLVMHAVRDTVVPIAQSRKFFRALHGPKKFVQLTHADHHLSATKYTDEVLEKVLTWFDDQRRQKCII